MGCVSGTVALPSADDTRDDESDAKKIIGAKDKSRVKAIGSKRAEWPIAIGDDFDVPLPLRWQTSATERRNFFDDVD